MDGVFVDTEPLVFTVFRKLFDSYGIDLHDRYQYKFIGQSFSRNLADIRNDFSIDFDEHHMRQRFDQVYEQTLAESNIGVQEGIEEVLELAAESGLARALCTTSTRLQVETLFARLERNSSVVYNEIFNVIVTGDEVRFKKPNAEPYLKVADALKVEPSSCLVIEDSDSGVQSATTAGCFCVGLRHPYNQHIDFSPANQVVERISDVYPLLKSAK